MYVNIFRLQNHLPDVYSRKSRDFQLFCNTFDLMHQGEIFSINNIRSILDPMTCPEYLLPHLQKRLGFFTDANITSNSLRIILKAFPTLVKNKGSRKGITQAVIVFLKINNIDKKSSIAITNKDNNGNPMFVIKISTGKSVKNTYILDEILKYIIPAGYRVEYEFYDSADFVTDIIPDDKMELVYATQNYTSGLRPAEDTYSMLLGRVDTTFTASNEINNSLNNPNPNNGEENSAKSKVHKVQLF